MRLSIELEDRLEDRHTRSAGFFLAAWAPYATTLQNGLKFAVPIETISVSGHVGYCPMTLRTCRSKWPWVVYFLAVLIMVQDQDQTMPASGFDTAVEIAEM